MFNVRMNSAGRALVFMEASIQGQLLLVYTYEFHCSINAACTVKHYLWFSVYSGMFLVVLEHFFMTNRQKYLGEMSFCM